MGGLSANEKRSLAELVRERFGGDTTARETVISVDTSRTRLVPNNPNRFRWMLINEGGNDVRVSIDPNLTASSGWLLPANGGVLEMNWWDDGSVVGAELFGFASGAASNVRVLEELRL